MQYHKIYRLLFLFSLTNKKAYHINMNILKKHKTQFYTCLFIGLIFLYTGSGYLSWLYHLMDYYDAFSTDLLSEVIGYLFQALGVWIFSLLINKNNKHLLSKESLIYITIIDLIFLLLSMIVPNKLLTVLLGYLMNLCHGLLAGYYLTKLSMIESYKASVFGIGYAIGSIGSYLISLIGDGSFLKDPRIFIIYVIVAFISILLNKEDHENIICTSSDVNHHTLLLASLLVVLLSVVKGTGFYFPAADLSQGVSLEFTRVFYAIGLILAGILSDKNRNYGAIACLCALIFPFLMLFLIREAVASSIVWIIGYIFYGFFIVYRVILFSDLSKDALYLAPLGLALGRIGDALGSLIGMLLTSQQICLFVLTTILFIITVIIFVKYYKQVYETVNEKYNDIDSLCHKYNISTREKEVLNLVLEGKTNIEISSELYISENTVKFHMKNLNKKFSVTSKQELIRKCKHILDVKD